MILNWNNEFLSSPVIEQVFILFFFFWKNFKWKKKTKAWQALVGGLPGYLLLSTYSLLVLFWIYLFHYSNITEEVSFFLHYFFVDIF